MIAVITGSGGLIGSEAVRFLAAKGWTVVGIDNNMREVFFGAEASTRWNTEALTRSIPDYRHASIDIRDGGAIDSVFATYGSDIQLVLHAAAQPSHDWAARAPGTDFSINAAGTLVLLEATRRYCPKAVFVYMSTNKVYGDTPNRLPVTETPTRWELEAPHPYAAGIDERMSLDQSRHSLFGVSKAAADLLVQEYGRCYGMSTACFRGGCLTGPSHSGTQLHGFLSYLMKCTMTGVPYKVFGHKGKQVRDNIHSYDLVNAVWQFYLNPRVAEVYNIGGSRFSNCSVLEAIDLCQQITGRELAWTYCDESRGGDHIWWISDVRKFSSHYPAWQLTYGIRRILSDIYEARMPNWTPASPAA
jgi:CDP-paratose 2-epimerase